VVNSSGPPRYLGADRPISFTQSLSLFAYARGLAPSTQRPAPSRLKPGAASREPGALVVGNPVFESPSAQRAAGPYGGAETRTARYLFWRGGRPPAPLPVTAEEARRIARLYRTAPLLGLEASELSVRRRISEARVIHLATHGFFLPTRAMSSGLLLSLPQQGASASHEDDGVLQAWEIYSQLRLKAELVVLSACETGRGQIVPSEGIIGLTRALQYAGARSVVASQWAVADASTARLMVAFHQRLRQGVAKDEALRQAMALTRNDPRTAHPYYWAPFFLTGNPEGFASSRLRLSTRRPLRRP
jgi:hypothetical protein